MFSNEIDRLLIQHIGDLDDGARRLGILQERVASTIDDVFNEWLDVKGWFPDGGHWKVRQDAALAPKHWVADEIKWLAWFSLGFGSGDDGTAGAERDSFWLTRLCKAGQGEMGLRFAQQEFGRTAWKKYLRDQAARFRGTRFIVDEEPSFFLPVVIDKEQLAKAFEEEDLKPAFGPLIEAFNYVHETVHLFDDLLVNFRKQQS